MPFFDYSLPISLRLLSIVIIILSRMDIKYLTMLFVELACKVVRLFNRYQYIYLFLKCIFQYILSLSKVAYIVKNDKIVLFAVC